MLTLALDTTADIGSIALVRGPEVLSEALLQAPEGFSRTLFREMEALLHRQGVALTDIDLFAAASGPGSFTGVRIGLAAVKGLGEVLGKPVLPISNLEALSTFGTAPRRATIIDARRGEVFAALWSAAGSQLIREQVIHFPHFLELAAGQDFEWISANFDPFGPALAGTPFESFPLVTAPVALAAAIAQIAQTRLSQGATGNPATVEANYVRRADAELFWKQLT